MKEGDSRVRVRETSEDAVLLALKMKEEHMSQGMQNVSKVEKGKETDSSLELVLQTPFQTSHLQNCKIISQLVSSTCAELLLIAIIFLRFSFNFT